MFDIDDFVVNIPKVKGALKLKKISVDKDEGCLPPDDYPVELLSEINISEVEKLEITVKRGGEFGIHEVTLQQYLVREPLGFRPTRAKTVIPITKLGELQKVLDEIVDKVQDE